jgi:HAD superfamily hydrolase (TIGR01509 family)
MDVQCELLASKTNILFDLDGTLVDSSPAHGQAFREAIDALAPDLAHTFEYEALKGRSTEEAFVYLGIRDLGLLAALTREKQQRFQVVVKDDRIACCEGAEALLKMLAVAGKRLFIVSGGSPASVRMTLESAGIRHFFEGVVDSGMVDRSKPAPDPYLTCLMRHNLAPEASLAVEDAENGVLSAQAAGLDVAVVHNPELGRRYRPTFASLIALHECLCAPQVVP